MSNSETRSDDLNPDGRPAAPARPWWLAAGIVGIGAVWLYGAFSLPQTAQYARIGPGLFVSAIGAALVLLGLLLAIQIGRGERFEPQASEDAEADTPADMRAFLTALAAAGVPLLTMRHLGFPITGALSFALVARAFGSTRLPLDLAIGLAITTIAYFGFIRLGVTLGGFLPLVTGR